MVSMTMTREVARRRLWNIDCNRCSGHSLRSKITWLQCWNSVNPTRKNTELWNFNFSIFTNVSIHFFFFYFFFFFVATSSSFPRLFSLLRTNALKYFLVAHGRLAETRELKLFDLLTELSCQVNINLTAVFINFWK